MAVTNTRDDTIQTIKETAAIAEVVGEHVNLKRAGANLKGLCPFHSEKTPSFIVNPARNTYHCFGCGEGGDVFSFMMNYHHMPFPEAVKELARRYNIILPEKQLSAQDQEKAKKRELVFSANEKAAASFHELLMTDRGAEAARSYLNKRGIPQALREEFRLGFAPDSWNYLGNTLGKEKISTEAMKGAGLIVAKDRGGFYDRFRNRIMFPIFNPTGRIIAFGGRILDDGQPKYMNSPESVVFDKSRTLFGIYQNRDAIRQARQCLVVEGNFDLLSLAAHGIRNVVAPLGTALTQAHVRTLKGYADEVILLFDGDAAGIKAAMRTVPIFLSERLSARVAVLPAEHDPDTFIQEQGADNFQKFIKAAQPLSEFVFDKLVAEYGLTLEGKSKIIEELRPLLAAMAGSRMERTIFISHFSKKLDIDQQQLMEGMGEKSQAAQRAADTQREVQEETTLPLKQRQLLEFLVIHNEYLADFLEAGIETVVVNRFGLRVLDLLKNQQQPDGGPENLLETATGPERSFISRLLISSPSHPDEVKEMMAQDMLTWLKKVGLKAEKERLLQRINEAHKTHDEQLWMELMAQKKQMDEAALS